MNEKSPAVQALENERARQGIERDDAALETGLKDSFPASDPVSVTSTAIPSGTPRSGQSSKSDDVTPLVDQALRSTEVSHSLLEPSQDPSAELAALRREISSLKQSVSQIGQASMRVAASEATEALDRFRDNVVARPLAAVGLAALAGYVWGLRR
jgi:ElaB/YqjD/DUF883 family membrane-anchored ribosome-binding protein